MHKLWLVALLSFFSSYTYAQTAEAFAQFKFEEETHNFGDLIEGNNATYEFVFTNTGNQPLVITNCKASCGCTTPSWPKEPIMPGKHGKITVQFDTKGKSGSFLKSIWVSSNAKTTREVLELYIKGNVVQKR
jgi:hypothetical protein